MADVEVKINMNLRTQIHAAAVQAVTEVFQTDILAAAKAGSPVGSPPDDKHPGRNRDSIQVSVRDNAEKGTVSAVLFTESGYGWLLERGTSRNRALTRLPLKRRHGKVAVADRTPARPYIMPAIARFTSKIFARFGEIIGASSEKAA